MRGGCSFDWLHQSTRDKKEVGCLWLVSFRADLREVFLLHTTWTWHCEPRRCCTPSHPPLGKSEDSLLLSWGHMGFLCFSESEKEPELLSSGLGMLVDDPSGLNYKVHFKGCLVGGCDHLTAFIPFPGVGRENLGIREIQGANIQDSNDSCICLHRVWCPH